MTRLTSHQFGQWAILCCTTSAPGHPVARRTSRVGRLSSQWGVVRLVSGRGRGLLVVAVLRLSVSGGFDMDKGK